MKNRQDDQRKKKKIKVTTETYICFKMCNTSNTPGNVVQGKQTAMQRKSLREQPAMSYGLDNYVNNKVSAPVLLFFDSFTAIY